MTFPEFLQRKYPIYGERGFQYFNPPISQVLADHEEWLAHQAGRTLEEKKRDAVNSFPKLNFADEAEKKI